MNNNCSENINSEEYWDKRFKSGDWDAAEGREQSLFFYTLATANLPEWLREDVVKNSLSVCDLGCAEGEGTDALSRYFGGLSVTGTDISSEALKTARKRYPACSFVHGDISSLEGEYDLIFSSNTFEHFENADVLIKNTMKHCKKYMVLLLPFREFNRIDEHFFTFDFGSFPFECEEMRVVFFKETDCRFLEGSRWHGSEILIVYQREGTEGINERTLAETGEAITSEYESAEERVRLARLEAEKVRESLDEAELKIKQLNERIEADRNAIMQIQFEAHQHKQEEIDLHETQVWRTGLKIEKLLQKTGIASVRSLLILADYKRMGLGVTLRRGLNEAFNRESTEHKKRRRLELCGQKFRSYKRERESVFGGGIKSYLVPFEAGLVSVVLPVYNGGELLRESIKSVIGQSYKNFELIIVNDGSTDESADIIEELARNDSRIRVVNQENKKLPTALSVGFREARGEFFTWTSADNIMLPDCLEVLAGNLNRKSDAAMVYGNMRLIDKNGHIKRGQFWYEKPLFSGNVCLPKNADCLNTYANNTIGAAFMYRRSAACILGDYSRFKTNLEDYDYWMRMNSLFKIEHTDEERPLYLYRIHEDSLTAHDKELGITKNRYKLMVLDDFRRDFYMASLVWVVDAENPEDLTYKEFCEALKDAGHLLLTRAEAELCGAAEKYSCFCYAYFGESPSEDIFEGTESFSGRVFVSKRSECPLKDGFDMLVCTEDEATEDAGDYKGWFKACDGRSVFEIAESKLKNKILYSLETLIEEPEPCEKKMSIIICTYMRGEKLTDAIWSVIRQSLSKKEYEIIIVDNAPFTSNIRAQVEDFGQKYSEYSGFIRYIGVPQKGLSYARNAGLWNAKGEYITFLDDDILADYYLLEEIFTGFKYHPSVGVIGGQVILERPFPTPKVLRKGWESLWSQFKIQENSFRETTQQFEFPYGANYSVRRSAVWRVGGFRMCYGRVGNDFAGGEETALAFKMLQIGYTIGLQPKAKVLHRVDRSRFTTEHVRKTIMAGIMTYYRFFLDLHSSVGWTERYVKNQIKITEAEIRILTAKKAEPLDIYYKKCYLEAYERLLKYMRETEKEG